MGWKITRLVAAERLGGTSGNEILTSAAALVLTLLLAAEGVTILRLGDLLSEHMFIGMLLIGPLLLKLGSTGYRFAQYYAGSRPYRQKGPPALELRLLAPALVASTVVVFVTGVLLLIVGHRTGVLLQLHKLSFIVWAGCFGLHFLAYLPRAVRSLGHGWTTTGRREVPGAGLRAALLLGSIGAGLVLAVALLTPIGAWHEGPSF